MKHTVKGNIVFIPFLHPVYFFSWDSMNVPSTWEKNANMYLRQYIQKELQVLRHYIDMHSLVSAFNSLKHNISLRSYLSGSTPVFLCCSKAKQLEFWKRFVFGTLNFMLQGIKEHHEIYLYFCLLIMLISIIHLCQSETLLDAN